MLWYKWDVQMNPFINKTKKYSLICKLGAGFANKFNGKWRFIILLYADHCNTTLTRWHIQM